VIGLEVLSQGREAQRIPALKDLEESFRVMRKLIWVVTPADGPFVGSVSLFFAKSDEQCEDWTTKNRDMLAWERFFGGQDS